MARHSARQQAADLAIWQRAEKPDSPDPNGGEAG
jgi:hypothetical protein